MTELPAGLTWCTGKPEMIRSSSAESSRRSNGRFDDQLVKACLPVLNREDDGRGFDEWTGTLVFGLTTDDRARLTSVCLYGSDFGNPVHFASCVAEGMLKSNQLLERNMSKSRYSIVYVFD